MKKLITSLVICSLAISGFAQSSDTTNISLGKKRIMIIDSNPRSDTIKISQDTSAKKYKNELSLVMGLDAGVNILGTPSGSMTMDSAASWLDLNHSRSLSWRMQVLAANFHLHKKYVVLKTGLGFAWNGYGLKNKVTMETRDSSAVYAVTDSLANFTKNKFRASYLTLPLLVQLNTDKDNKEFHLTAGVIGGWNMGSLIRQKWEYAGVNASYKKKEDFNVNPFTLDATARVGYKGFTLFATYGLTPLFAKNKGPEVYPMTVGLQIIPW